MLSVTEQEIEQARNQLAHQGFYLEETSAVVVATSESLPTSSQTAAHWPLLVLLTGDGLETSPER